MESNLGAQQYESVVSLVLFHCLCVSILCIVTNQHMQQVRVSQTHTLQSLALLLPCCAWIRLELPWHAPPRYSATRDVIDYQTLHTSFCLTAVDKQLCAIALTLSGLGSHKTIKTK